MFISSITVRVFAVLINEKGQFYLMIHLDVYSSQTLVCYVAGPGHDLAHL